MRTLVSMVALLTTPLVASAEPLVIHSKGGLHVWVDGESYGKLSRRGELVLELPTGEHEVVASYSRDLKTVHCYGLTTVDAEGAVVSLRHQRCDGLREGLAPAEHSAVGALIRVKEMSRALVRMDIDGERVPRPGLETLYNVAPGEHVLTFSHDVARVFDDMAQCDTPVEVTRDEIAFVFANAEGCIVDPRSGPRFSLR